MEDWYWAAQEIPTLDWTPRQASSGDQNVLVLPTGPADDLETCGLFFVHMINAAQQRLWITSPYFVPDPQVICALQLASLRGVDVRIMLPEHAKEGKGKGKRTGITHFAKQLVRGCTDALDFGIPGEGWR
jgi:cardiolipin synthase